MVMTSAGAAGRLTADRAEWVGGYEPALTGA